MTEIAPSMASPDLVARLAQHRALADAPRAELEWLVAHGQLRRIQRGEYLTRMADVMQTLVIVLSGHIAIYIDRGLGPRKVMEWGPGDVTGVIPYSRMSKAPGQAMVDESGDMFTVHRDHHTEMIRECPTITTTLVHLMLDRVRRFTSSDLQDEKMISLGRLSAGLAHELNNPASAAVRSARLLAGGLTALEDASSAFGAAGLTEAQRATVERARKACQSKAPSALTPIERADREDVIATWLGDHDSTVDAADLVDTAVSVADLDLLASTLDGGTLDATLRWLAADCAARALTAEVERAATRVHDLVASVKRYTYMDRTSAPEAVDLAVTVNDSVALLLHKARKKSVAVSVTFEPNLPRVRAIASDLNQVWTNLIDNALDAVAESGHVTISAARLVDFVIVRIVDDGPGIPEGIRHQIFDPFVTTKPIGQGTGQGLEIAKRLVQRNDGDIDFDSQPGRTEFRVTLRVAAESPGSDA